jgi:serine/threonine protein kinase
LLPSHIIWNDSTWKTIVTSGFFSSRLNNVYSEEDAWLLYSDAERIPHTQTRAEALCYLNLKIDGAIQVPGIQTAVFLYAFLSFKPMVLKIPREISKVVKECKLYESIGTMAEKAEIALVPVESIKLKGHQIKDGSAAKIFDKAILMPIYACSLEEIPPPISVEYALLIFVRLSEAILFLIDKCWLHGDIKPSNIFIDHLGVTWVGDYGSSVKYENVREFTGGTPAYQCPDIGVVNNLHQFDKVGLVISLLEKLMLIPPRGLSEAVVMNYDTLLSVINEMEDESSILKGLMLSFLDSDVQRLEEPTITLMRTFKFHVFRAA